MRNYVIYLPLVALLVGCEAKMPPTATLPVHPIVDERNTMPDSKPSEPKSSDEKSVEDKKLIEKVKKTERQWRKELTRQEYQVLRQKGTERRFTGKYDEHFEAGAYACAACGLVLFESDTKFNSGCGWPAFYAAKAGDRVVQTPDYSHGMVRVEVTCARCDGHLGHVFQDAPDQPTGQRYCINSVSLDFIPKGKLAERGDAKAEAASDKPQEPAKEKSDEVKPAEAKTAEAKTVEAED
ncbi:peptide-methionine (R)-S-oxide reductase MsrB [Aeoliella sp. ICT_H6.2]|uniref:Peptide methionine sulfoxide reductase MsrB n=1 Tax=Aeoliella straminimaris TaxID=2954799 RepID=A0A9X2FAF7_9BACT|nr:peptide-methionine (R)-S-oxide reductase MsrB [Aeoliella straminimaris]MCO6044919.1 peptide-methionine (R)-S-oxide reductase MsrB [Aeoliella straminimaris]